MNVGDDHPFESIPASRPHGVCWRRHPSTGSSSMVDVCWCCWHRDIYGIIYGIIYGNIWNNIRNNIWNTMEISWFFSCWRVCNNWADTKPQDGPVKDKVIPCYSWWKRSWDQPVEFIAVIAPIGTCPWPSMTHLSLEVNPFETKLLIALPEEQIFQQSPQVGVVGPILKTQAAAVVQVGRLGSQIWVHCTQWPLFHLYPGLL